MRRCYFYGKERGEATPYHAVICKRAFQKDPIFGAPRRIIKKPRAERYACSANRRGACSIKKDRRIRGGYKVRLCDEMLAFFNFPAEGAWDSFRENGIPSFVKFAKAHGLTLSELREFRDKHPEFRLAYGECEARLRDLLVDGVLTKHFDASFAKLLLQEHPEEPNDGAEKAFDLTLTVLHE